MPAGSGCAPMLALVSASAGQPTHCPALHAQRDPYATPAHQHQLRNLPIHPKPPPDHCQAIGVKVKVPGPPHHDVAAPPADSRQTPSYRHANPSLLKTLPRPPRHAMLASRKMRCTDVRARAHGGAARAFRSPTSPMPGALRLLGHHHCRATTHNS